MRIIRAIGWGLVLLPVTLPLQAQTTVVGDWHGVLQSPIGPMTLVVTITEGEKGALRGEMASPDQGPGKMPLTSVSDERRPSRVHHEARADFVRRRVGRGRAALVRCVHAGREDAADVPARPATRTARGRGTRRPVAGSRSPATVSISAWCCESRPPIAARSSRSIHRTWEPLACRWPGSRDAAQDVGFSVPASGARFAGTLSDDGTRLQGIWTLPGQPDVEVAFVRTRATAERERASAPADAEAAISLPCGRCHVQELLSPAVSRSLAR